LRRSNGTFHDITTGNNGAYSAHAGWDALHRLGTPVGSAIVSALAGSKTAGKN